MAERSAGGAVLWTGPIGEPDRYHVTAESLAAALHGGEGLVYRATDTHRHAPVALKVLTVVELNAYGRLAARAAAFESISHPNLMSLIDVFIGRALTDRSEIDPDDFDVIYSVAEWIEGAPLADVVADADTATVLGYVADVARALDALHEHRDPSAPAGIVHRDVKPSNVRVTPDGAAVLIDFGAARPVDDSGDMTQGVGTYRWRAPEVLTGSAPLSTAIDAWGLGALAYWGLTGQPPGLEGAAAAREQLVHTTRSQELRDPVAVATHIASLLESDPVKRPSDLGRWADELAAILAGRRRPRWRRPITMTAATLLAVPLGVVVAQAGRDEPSETEATVASVPATDPAARTAPPPETTVRPAGLVPAVGDVWEVGCVGAPEQMIVTGAEPGQVVWLYVTYAPEVPEAIRASHPDPLSEASGLEPDAAPTVGPRTINIGPPEIKADASGSFVVEWRCSRRQVGVPVLLELRRTGESRVVRVESRDQLADLDILIEAATGSARGGDVATLVAGTSYRLDVRALLSTGGVGSTAPVSGRNFDPELRVRSSDGSLLRVTESPDGSWVVTALRTGTGRLDAIIPHSGHATTQPVEVVDPPAPTLGPNGELADGAVAAYLGAVLNAGPAIVLTTTGPYDLQTADSPRPYWPVLSACDDAPAVDPVGWVRAEAVYLLPNPEFDASSLIVHTFPDDASARAWSDRYRQAIDERAGRPCPFGLGEPTAVPEGETRTYQAASEVGPGEFVAAFSVPGGREAVTSVTTVGNLVVMTEAAGADDLVVPRAAIAAATSALAD